MDIRNILFYIFLFMMAIVIGLNISSGSNYLQSQVDERIYKSTIDYWNERGLSEIYINNPGENKPLPFLYIQRILNADATKTKLLNAILILINTILIYQYTKNEYAGLYPLIYVFLNSLWLTTEIIETLFIILALSYRRYSGVFVGLSAVFRPYALIYSMLLSKKHVVYVGIITIVFMVLMYSQGILQEYVHRLVSYGMSQGPPDMLPLLIIVPMIISSVLYGEKQITRFGFVSMLPLLFRQYAHYYIPCYTLFFMNSLKKRKENQIMI